MFNFNKEPYMQYDVKTPTEYFNALDEDWRKEKLEEVRTLILSKHNVDEGINYKMLSYSAFGDVIFHLNAQKNFVGLYVGNIEKVDPEGELLNEFNVGKGCIRISKTKPVSGSSLPLFIDKVFELAQQHKDLSC
jgi:uncharacterized protein YdhG (YjbR/CyaY superfamily)